MASREESRYDEERRERIRRNNETLQFIIDKKLEMANMLGGNLGSGASDQSNKKRKVVTFT